MTDNDRSYRKIEFKHLNKLNNIAELDQNLFIERHPKYKFFKEQKFCVLLVQGAALHYLDNRNGIKDFDILILYKENLNQKDETGKVIKIPYRRLFAYDCGMPEFGRYSGDDIKKYPNRRVDVLMREINNQITSEYDLTTAITKYFETGQTKSIQCWRNKAAIGIWPEEIQGKVLWPQNY